MRPQMAENEEETGRGIELEARLGLVIHIVYLKKQEATEAILRSPDNEGLYKKMKRLGIE